MAVTADQVRTKLNASAVSVPNADIEQALRSARVLVDKYIGSAAVPADVVDLAVCRVATEEITQDKAPNGVLNQAFDTGIGDGTSAYTQMRISRDPMKPAYPLLDPFVSSKGYCA